MNLKEIRDDVRSLIIEPTPGFRSNIELNRWINQAHQELGMIYRIEKTVNINITRGLAFYDLPEDLLVLKGAWNEANEDIPIIPVTAGTDISNEEMSLYRYGTSFVLIPAPATNTYIKLFYERVPKMLRSDLDEPEIPIPYHKYLVSYAVMRALEKDEDYEAAAFYQQEYELGKQLLSAHKLPLSQDSQAVFDLMRYGILNPAEAASYLNLPMKDKIWKRIEVEDKAFRLLDADVISRDDLIKNTVFPDKEKIEESLKITQSDLAKLPSMWEDDIND